MLWILRNMVAATKLIIVTVMILTVLDLHTSRSAEVFSQHESFLRNSAYDCNETSVCLYENDQAKCSIHGILLVCHNNSPLAVCGDSWNHKSAQVACREMGLVASSLTNIFEEVMNYSYHPYTFHCSGNETNLMGCYNKARLTTCHSLGAVFLHCKVSRPENVKILNQSSNWLELHAELPMNIEDRASSLEYYIRYYPWADPVAVNSEGPCSLKSILLVNSTSSRLNVKITDLKPNTKYSIEVAAAFHGHIGPYSRIIYGTTAQDTTVTIEGPPGPYCYGQIITLLCEYPEMAGTAYWKKNGSSFASSSIETIVAMAGNQNELKINFTKEAFPDHYLYYTCHISDGHGEISSDKYCITLLSPSNPSIRDFHIVSNGILLRWNYTVISCYIQTIPDFKISWEEDGQMEHNLTVKHQIWLDNLKSETTYKIYLVAFFGTYPRISSNTITINITTLGKPHIRRDPPATDIYVCNEAEVNIICSYQFNKFQQIKSVQLCTDSKKEPLAKIENFSMITGDHEVSLKFIPERKVKIYCAILFTDASFVEKSQSLIVEPTDVFPPTITEKNHTKDSITILWDHYDYCHVNCTFEYSVILVIYMRSPEDPLKRTEDKNLTISNLHASTTYTISIRAYCMGEESKSSDTISFNFTTDPASSQGIGFHVMLIAAMCLLCYILI